MQQPATLAASLFAFSLTAQRDDTRHNGHGGSFGVGILTVSRFKQDLQHKIRIAPLVCLIVLLFLFYFAFFALFLFDSHALRSALH